MCMFVACPVIAMVGSNNEHNVGGGLSTRVNTMPAATEAPPRFTTRPTAATWYPEKTTTGQLESKLKYKKTLSNDSVAQCTYIGYHENILLTLFSCFIHFYI